MSHEVIWVVAGALEGPNGRWLMHRRPEEKHHGGLWEFPGGKVEDTEIPSEALVRELHEELGIEFSPEDCEPICFAEEARGNSGQSIVILLYRLRQWRGEPRALEGGRIDWFAPEGIKKLDKPPLDMVLAERMFEKVRARGQNP